MISQTFDSIIQVATLHPSDIQALLGKVRIQRSQKVDENAAEQMINIQRHVLLH